LPTPPAPLIMTTIIATIGPACASVDTLADMIAAGMTIARMNFSHGDYAFHTRIAAMVREAATRAGKPVMLLADLQGAKVRLGWLDREAEIVEGQPLILVGQEDDARERIVALAGDVLALPVDFDLAPHLEPESTVLIDDGLLELVVEEIVDGQVHCRVIHGGTVKSRKGVNVPYTLLPIPALTEKDRADVAFAVDLNVDWIALSFAGSAEDVHDLRDLIRTQGRGFVSPRIMAKIERPDGVENLRAIIGASDGVMVARGDLALETSPWQLPLLQKQIVRACQEGRKPVAVATQMLESMINNHRPTRAEVSDVANALLDGADAVMLSAETAVGSYPVQAVRTMTVISQGLETSMQQASVASGFQAALPKSSEPLRRGEKKRQQFVL
jgi:pyruvate kinase